ncbi:MAG: FtsW/RodA/SpoVE family cell cycle protein [Bacteroidales bacterium]|nr:FtsW/RodA/SpoVE family cell cycle protein [Bacteroidales bacterium]
MAKKTRKEKRTIWTMVDRFEGDKVIWMIVLLLVMFSLLTIFSSTPLLALIEKKDRMAIFSEQVKIELLGLVIIIVLYNIRSIKLFRVLSKYGFLLALTLLLLLAMRIQTPVVRAISTNEAVRALSFMGFQVHVFEVVKVIMVMYLAWAVDTYKQKGFKLTTRLAKLSPKLAFIDNPLWQRIFYLYGPILITCALILTGGVSSALFIGCILYLTILIGGISIRDVVLPGIVSILFLLGSIGIYKATDGKVFNRIGTAVTRITPADDEYIAILTDTTTLRTEGLTKDQITEERAKRVKAFDEAKNKLAQPYSAKIAIHQGGLIGKGPGESTQRYYTPVMFSDYMYSFILEEYGLLGGILVLILYVSLIARGASVNKYLDDYFAKTAVAGLIVLIAGQAFMHIAINLEMVPRTGQTLPMISHGNSSFLSFCVAFGVILSFSRASSRKHKAILAEEEARVAAEEAEKQRRLAAQEAERAREQAEREAAEEFAAMAEQFNDSTEPDIQ